MMKSMIPALLTLLLLGCGDVSPKPANNANNVNNANNANNVNNANNANNVNNVNNQGPTYVDPNDFDRACEWDSECSLVFGGDYCGCLDVCADSIATSAIPDFTAATEAVDCSERDQPVCPAIACEVRMAVCSSGRCTGIAAFEVDAAKYDQSCDVAEDCTLIPVGPICSDCACDAGAINVDALPEYEADVSGVDCQPGPNVCDCAPPSGVVCNEGQCAVGF